MNYLEHVKFYKDFPKEGINFIDIIPLIQDKEVYRSITEDLSKAITASSVATVESRGFFFAPALLAHEGPVNNIIPVRKSGKLPFKEGDLRAVAIEKEYGSDNVFFRYSDIAAGTPEDGVFKVAIMDDVLATGGTALGIAKALEESKIVKDGKEYGVKVSEFVFLVSIDVLGGAEKLEKIAPVHSLIHLAD